jgi:hypothetical protein
VLLFYSKVAVFLMDREAFFHALPFLAPVSSGEEWPPPNGSCDVILQDCMLSVEPSAAGPACFAVSANGQDSAMFSIDMCLLTTDKQNLTSPASSSVSTSLSLSQTSKHASQDTNDQKENHIVIYIDKKLVLQVDLSLLVTVELHETQCVDPKVPHLLLQFDPCAFRLFLKDPLDREAHSGSSGSGAHSSVESLKTAACRLKKEMAAFEKRMVLSGNEQYLLPMECITESPTSHKNAVQQHGGSDKERLQDTNANNKIRIQQKKSTLKRSWDALQALQLVLDMPHDTVAQGDDDIVETISPILNTAATELASSYSRKSHVRDAIQNCTNEIASFEAQLNNVFSAGFPPPTRNRRHASPIKTTQAPTQDEDTETLLATAQTLLEKQKAAMKERLELFLLPTRG